MESWIREKVSAVASLHRGKQKSVKPCNFSSPQEAIMRTEEKGSMKEKMDSMQKKYDVSY